MYVVSQIVPKVDRSVDTVCFMFICSLISYALHQFPLLILLSQKIYRIICDLYIVVA